MARSLNQCNFIGNLGKDPETRVQPSGDGICTFSIAVSDGYKDKSGNQVDTTEWVNCTAFGKLADICSQYLHKGSKVFVSGKMRTRKWQDTEGKDRYSTGIVIDIMQMLDGREQAPAAVPQQAPQQPQFDDDLPF